MVSFQEVPGIAITFVVIAIIIGVAGSTLIATQEQQCADAEVVDGNTGVHTAAVWNESSGTCINDSGGNPSVMLSTSGQCYGGACYALNSTDQGLSANSTLADWQPTWAIVIAAVVIIGLISFFWIQRR